MIDHDLSDQLHSLAASVDEPFDLDALHRRMSAQGRRRAVVKAGFACAGVAALVAGLFVVRNERLTTVASQAEPTASPACDVVLAAMRSAKSTDTVVPKGISTDRSGFAGDVTEIGFKGIVTILTIDGSRLTFRIDEPNDAPATTGAGAVDAATVWVDGPTTLDTPPTLQVGEQLGLATTRTTDGDDHVIFIDVSDPTSSDDRTAPDNKPTTTGESSGPTLPPGPTDKSLGTITGVDATTITVTPDASGPATSFAIDLSSTPFYAGDTRCLPGSLAVGTALGVAYHLDGTGNVISDAVMLMP